MTDDTHSISSTASSIEILSESGKHRPLARKLVSIVLFFVLFVILALLLANIVVVAVSVSTNASIVLDLEGKKRSQTSLAVVTQIDNMFTANQQIMQGLRFAVYLSYNNMKTFFTNADDQAKILNLMRTAVTSGMF
jgi:hypothetical protein